MRKLVFSLRGSCPVPFWFTVDGKPPAKVWVDGAPWPVFLRISALVKRDIAMEFYVPERHGEVTLHTESPATLEIEHMGTHEGLKSPSTELLRLAAENESLKAELSQSKEDVTRLREALEKIIKENQIEVKHTIRVDPAGNTYEVEEVDGGFAGIARAALSEGGS